MGWHDAASVVAYGVLACLAGNFVLRLLGVARCGMARCWSVYYLTGQCCLLLLALLTAIPGIGMGAPLATMLLIVAGVWIVRRVEWSDARLAQHVIGILTALLVVILLYPTFAVSITRIPLHAWDARSIWFFHGKAIFFDHGILGTAFSDTIGVWSHADYPLLVPAQAAWVAFLRGNWFEAAARGFLLLNVAAYVDLIFKALRTSGWSILLAAGAVILLVNPGELAFVNGYVDLHYVMALTLAALYMPGILPHNTADKDHVVFWIGLAWALNCKNESQLYVLILLLFLSFRWLFQHVPGGFRRLAAIRSLLTARGVWLFAMLGMLPAVMWKLFCEWSGISGDMQVTGRLSDLGLVGRLIVERTVPVSGELMALALNDGLLAAMLAWLLLLVLRHARRHGANHPLLEPGELFLPLASLCVTGIVAVMFIMTPHPLGWHMETAGYRLLFLPRALMTLAALLMFNKAGNATNVPSRSCL